MKPITKQSDKKTAFTIIELLTVMSIIVILIGLLLPSLTMVKRYSKEVRQRAQFHSIEAALELFHGEWGSYPSSSAKDDSTAAGVDYCGAMKLCEAMVGQDLVGFNPNSHFWANCTVNGTDLLYDNPPVGAVLWPTTPDNLKARKSYLQADSANAYRLRELYGTGNVAPFTNENLFVLCDVYNRVKNHDTGKSIGMPILYYKANVGNTIHDPNGTTTAFPTTWNNDNGYIYNYLDNDALVHLGPAGVTHPLDGSPGPTNFYKITQDKRISIKSGWPYRPDSYILISAGFDGVYGTDDDIFDFEK